MKFALGKIAEALGRPLTSPAMVTGWSIDSRTVQPSDLFFALRGAHHDGHDYASAAAAAGAVGIVADREVAAACPVILVQETHAALQQLAAWARQRWGGKIVAV